MPSVSDRISYALWGITKFQLFEERNKEATSYLRRHARRGLRLRWRAWPPHCSCASWNREKLCLFKILRRYSNSWRITRGQFEAMAACHSRVLLIAENTFIGARRLQFLVGARDCCQGWDVRKWCNLGEFCSGKILWRSWVSSCRTKRKLHWT